MLTPSMRMLIVFCGKPLMVELREFCAPPGVSTPGKKIMKLNTLRSDRGTLLMNSWVIVELTVGDCVRTRLVCAFTSTLSLIAPTSITV